MTFETQVLQPRRRTFLWLGAVNGTSRVWLDDKLIDERLPVELRQEEPK